MRTIRDLTIQVMPQMIFYLSHIGFVRADIDVFEAQMQTLLAPISLESDESLFHHVIPEAGQGFGVVWTR